MREVSIINGFKNIQNLIALVEDNMKTALAGEMMMQQAMRITLVKKGIFTDKELADALSEVIESNNKAAKEAQEKKAKGIIKPTVEQSAKVEATKKDIEVKKDAKPAEKK